jgi:hypothetical protein
MSTETIGCSHPDCQCQVTAVLDADSDASLETYCSDYCRNSEEGHERSDEACACGHPQCDEP